MNERKRERKNKRKDAQAWWRYLFVDNFPCPDDHSSLSMWISDHAESILSDLSGYESDGSWVVLIPPYVPCPLLSLISSLHWTLLCFSPAVRKRMFFIEKYCPTSVCSFFPDTSCSFPQHVITSNPCLAPQPSSYWYLRHAHYPLIFWASIPVPNHSSESQGS